MNVEVADERVVVSWALTLPTLKRKRQGVVLSPASLPGLKIEPLRQAQGRLWGTRFSSTWFARALVAATLVVFAGAAWGQHFKVDPAASEVHFTLGASDGPVNGSFRVTGGEFTLDQASGAMTGTVSVDATSGTSGNQKRDKKMKNDQMKAETYPAVTFAPSKFSGAVKDAGDFTGQVDGNFTLLGKEHPVSVPMSVHMEGDRFSASGEFTVPFVSWGMKDPSFMMFKVEKEVKVQLKLSGTVSK